MEVSTILDNVMMVSKEQESSRPLMPQDIFSEGERPLFESRPVFWPMLTWPVIVAVLGLIVLLYSGRLPLDSIVTFLGQPSYETVIRFVIRCMGLGILVLGIYCILVKLLQWRCIVYAATNRRILTKTGIVIKSYTDCSFSRIQTLQMRISLQGRILNYGTIKIAMDGKGAAVITWENLKNPKYAFRQLSEIVEEYRQNKVTKEPVGQR